MSIAQHNKNRNRGRRPHPNLNGSGPYDEMAMILDEWADERDSYTQPRLARVTGVGSNNKSIRIQFDDEDESDGIDYAHAGGRKNAGDTVLMFPLGGGSGWVGLGPVFTDDRVDSMQVDGDDIRPNSIDTRHIRPKAVKGDNIEQKAIGRGHLENNAVGRDEIDNSLFQGLAQKSDVQALRTDMGRMRGDIMSRIADIKKKAAGGGEDGGP